MKKYIKIIVPLFSIIFIFLCFQTIKKINNKKKSADRINTIPSFSFKLTDGKDFTKDNLRKNTPTVFVYFNSECEFCQSETAQISDKVDSFAQTQLLFISFEQPKVIEDFSKKNKLNNYGNIHFLYDRKMDFSKIFDVNTLPSTVIYDNNNKLIEKIKGPISAEQLLEMLFPYNNPFNHF